MFIEHPPKNLMTSPALCSIRVQLSHLRSWVCIANSAVSYRRHLIDDTKPEASAASQRNGFDEFIDDLDETLLPNLAK
jgi:hypothetical protein